MTVADTKTSKKPTTPYPIRRHTHPHVWLYSERIEILSGKFNFTNALQLQSIFAAVGVKAGQRATRRPKRLGRKNSVFSGRQLDHVDRRPSGGKSGRLPVAAISDRTGPGCRIVVSVTIAWMNEPANTIPPFTLPSCSNRPIAITLSATVVL